MEYRKERNLFIAAEGTKIKGQYDSATGIYYGAKGTPIKSMPAAFKDSIYSRIFTSHQWILSHVTDETLIRALTRWEQLASLGLYTNEHDVLVDEAYAFPALKKDLVKYIKDKYDGCYSPMAQRLYDIQKDCPEYELLTQKIQQIVNYIIIDNPDYAPFSYDWCIKAMLRLQLEDGLYMFDAWSLYNYILEYYKSCKEMNQEPVITKNFLITIAHMKHLYENYKAETMNKRLLEHNDIPELYYEDDTYIVRPLLTREEFHNEAEAQHNCVERLYMERVADGDTHVVTVRKKNTPDVSLVTCEISNDMHIIQYYTKYNTCPALSEQNFKAKLAEYLHSLSLSKE